MGVVCTEVLADLRLGLGVRCRRGGRALEVAALDELRLRRDGAPLEPSHRRDEQEVPEAQARRGVEEGVVGAGLGLPAVALVWPGVVNSSVLPR